MNIEIIAQDMDDNAFWVKFAELNRQAVKKDRKKKGKVSLIKKTGKDNAENNKA